MRWTAPRSSRRCAAAEPRRGDPGIGRDSYFERCWPNAARTAAFAFVRLEEVGEEVLVTYELTKGDGGRFRNAEIFGFDEGKIAKVEVYFGWDL